eukprot:jgi/Chlat1/7784/Chrsp66S07240
MFVQGSKDSMCPLDLLQSVRDRMRVETGLHVVEGGSHSLEVGKRRLGQLEMTQSDVDSAAATQVASWLRSILTAR